jgi:hypothetical protein
MPNRKAEGDSVSERELKPCPFCGGTPHYDNDTGPNDEYFTEWSECADCGASVTGTDEWNRRPQTPDFDAALEKAYDDFTCGDDELVKLAFDAGFRAAWELLKGGR